MTAYGPLAAVYDRLTGDVGYERRADYIQRPVRQEPGSRSIPSWIWPAAPGTMTAILTERGYELIAVDASPDMLAQAREKAAEVPGEPPVFLNQDMPKLDLYGTVDARHLLPGQPQLPHQPQGRAADLPAAAPVHRPRRPPGVRCQQRRQAPGSGRTGVSGRDGGRLLRMAGRSLKSGARPAATGWIFYPPPRRRLGPGL